MGNYKNKMPKKPLNWVDALSAEPRSFYLSHASTAVRVSARSIGFLRTMDVEALLWRGGLKKSGFGLGKLSI